MQIVDRQTHTVEEYFEIELNSQERHEYRDGEIILMAGGTPAHNRISGNLYIILSLALKRQPYETFHIDQRLAFSSFNFYVYPDVMVVEKPIQLQERRTDSVMNACFIAEILSKSTQDYDRGGKFAAYRSIPTFREYLLIDQYRIYVEHYVKTSAHQWLLSEYSDPNISLTLSTFDMQIQIADLYENIDFATAESVSIE